MHPKNQQTLVILKPDAVQRGLIGEILSRIERTGLKLVAAKFFIPKEEQCWKHYNKDDVWFMKKGTGIVADRTAAGLPIEKEPLEYGKDIIRANVDFFTSGPVMGLIFEGNESVAVVKKIVGGTEPTVSDVGTIRGDLTIDSYALSARDGRAVRNLVHCTDNPAESAGEIALWFTPEEIINYRLVGEQILYDVNLDGILE